VPSAVSRYCLASVGKFEATLPIRINSDAYGPFKNVISMSNIVLIQCVNNQKLLLEVHSFKIIILVNDDAEIKCRKKVSHWWINILMAESRKCTCALPITVKNGTFLMVNLV
jgi:hypothetical protein